jgi:hypothetical protein
LIDDSKITITSERDNQTRGDYTFDDSSQTVNPPNPTVGYTQKEVYSYMSYSGADAVATLLIPPIGQNGSTQDEGEILTLGELQTISYSIHRENAPIRILGRVNPKSFIKGSRTIAGSLIFTVFNEYAFYKIRKYRELLGRQNGFFAPLADMLPPFDIILTFSNEYGQMSKMKILGVTIVDEGQTVSIDDLIIEQTYTFMARGIQPLVAMRLPELTGSNIGKEEYDSYNLDISRNIFGDRSLEEVRQIRQRDLNTEVRTQSP